MLGVVVLRSVCFFFSSRRRHTRCSRDWSSDVCSSDLELLRLVSERDPKAVFPLVERLVDAGADLGEFVAGAGEIVRAVLLAGLGGEPEGFTDALLALIERYRSPLPAADLVRLLAVLSELEPQLRAGSNAR